MFTVKQDANNDVKLMDMRLIYYETAAHDNACRSPFTKLRDPLDQRWWMEVLFMPGPGPLQPRQAWRYINTWVNEANAGPSHEANASERWRRKSAAENFSERYTAGRQAVEGALQ